MPNYAGRYDFGVSRKNFGGIEDQSSLLTTADNAAIDILNFDLSKGGEITRRGGTELIYNFGSPVVHFKKFLYNGTEVFFAITSNGKFWSATDPAGTWTDRTGSVVWTDFTSPIISSVLAGKLVICNGTDAPLIYVHGSNMQTLKDASLQTVATTSATAVGVGAGGGATNAYFVAGVTPRGYTPLFSVTSSGIKDMSILTASVYNTVSWVNNGEFTAFYIFCTGSGGARSGTATTLTANAGTEIYYWLLATLGAAATSWNDVGGEVQLWSDTGASPGTGGRIISPSLSSTAYNTPEDWETNGYPSGVAYVGKNRDERLFAWRKKTVWGCSLSEPTNWYREDDAFAFTLIGSEDTNIKGIAGLFDYTMIMSASDTFLYTGASGRTITLSKVIPVGCASHNSITYAGQDVYFWSNYGPTNASRIIQGADVAVNTTFTQKIQNLIFTSTNTTAWNKIAGATDIVNNRIYFGVPKAAASTNNQSIVYNYEVDGFVRYDGFSWVGSCVYQNDVYVGSEDGKIYKMNSGNTDNGAAITASYTTGWLDVGSFPMNKRMMWVDVVADRRPGNYTFSLDYAVDFNQYEGTAQTATQTTTNGQTIETTGSQGAEHRFYTEAIGNSFQLIFSTSATTPLTLVAWRPEIRARGVRQ